MIIIYHNNCSDGFGAAWVAYTHYTYNAVYIPWDAGDTTNLIIYLNGLIETNYLDRNDGLLSFDLAWEYDTLQQLKSLFYKAEVYDHHISSRRSIPNEVMYFHFDNTISGVQLAWNYFYPGAEMPLLLQYIQDRDLWEFKLENSREINEGIHSLLHLTDFNEWDKAVRDCNFLSKALRVGTKIQRKKIEKVTRACSRATLKQIGNHRVYILEVDSNSRYLRSDIGSTLYSRKCESTDGNFECDYVLMWFWSEENRRYWVSLRSNKENSNAPDVGIIAKSLSPNGGGHKNAAGFYCTERLEFF